MSKDSQGKKSVAKAEKKTLVLLDSHAIIHRAYHALPDFSTSKGVPTGALYGLSTMLIGILEKFKPDYVVACYDLPQPTYRHEAYDAYKAGRKKSDPALVAQLNSSRELFEKFGIPMYDKPGFEADDMLGTIVEEVVHPKTATRKKEFENVSVIVASGDMDTLQLVEGDRVRVFTLKKGIKDTVTYNEKSVMERFGFGPELLPDYKGLRGDPSDNIIGIAGIGEKTATTLITTFGSLENMYKALKKKDAAVEFKKIGITERVFELLKNGEEEALFSKMLATIRRDAPIDFVLPEKRWVDGFDADKAEAFFRELEFRTMTSRVKQVTDMYNGLDKKAKGESGGGESIKSAVSAPTKIRSIDEMLDDDNTDAETGGGASGQLALGVTRTFDDVTHDVPDELRKKLCIALWVIDSNITNPSLEDVLQHTDNHKLLKEIVTLSKDEILVRLEKVLEGLQEEIKKQKLERVYSEIELPLIPIINEMEKVGIKLDLAYLKKMSEKYHKKLSELEAEIWKQAGMEFNVASPKQLGEVLFDKLGLGDGKRIKKTAGGARSTKESELEKMRGTHPVIDLVLEHRELSKLLGTYIDPLPMLVDAEGRVHAHFIQTGAVTGRMASQDPGLQNIPIKTEYGRPIRNAFIVEKGYKMVSFDYSQIELRIAAFLSGDKKLIEIFKNGIDVHSGVAAQVFKVKPEEVTKTMRIRAKTINFGILYGMGVNALRANLESTREEAQQFYNEYFETFTGLAEYLNQVKIETKRRGYTETFYGRKRRFEGLSSPLPFIRAAAERMAINAPIQGTEADIVKIAMKRIDDVIKRDKFGARLLLQVHDELVYEVPEAEVEKFMPVARTAMEDILTLKETAGVPIVSEGHVGENWGEMK